MCKGIIKSTVAVFVLFIFMTMIATSALAQKPEVNITSVSIDFDNGTMTIKNGHLDWRIQALLNKYAQ